MSLLKHYDHSIMIDADACTGCVRCTLACPVEAIRVRGGKAVLIRENLCIDCGECLRICPHQAVKAMTTQYKDLTGFKAVVALPSPVLYGQFGEQYTPNDILLALHRIGFDYVYDVAFDCEMVMAAVDEYLRRETAPRPMISIFCTPVVRMITKNYPKLVDHLTPVRLPREHGAKMARRKVAEERGIRPEEVGVFHITPCSAKIVSIAKPIGVDKSYLDGVIAIRDLYLPLKSALKEVEKAEDDLIIQRSSGVGMSWAIGRGSIYGLPRRASLSVSGVNDVIGILDDLDAGRHTDIDYLECSICPEGCVGGPLVVENKHVATSRIESLIEQYGVQSRIDPRKVLRQFEQHFLLDRERFRPQTPEPLDSDLRKALEKMAKIEEYAAMLPGIQCGACGSPTCRALAEDIVRGHAKFSDCVFVRIKELEDAAAGRTARAGS